MYQLRIMIALLLLGSLACTLSNTKDDSAAQPFSQPRLESTITQIPAATITPTAQSGIPTQDESNSNAGSGSVNTTCTPRTDWLVYRVVQGDTLGTIAQRTNSTIQALSTANCLNNPNQISVGQAIYVPQLPSSPPASGIGSLSLTMSPYQSFDGSAYSFAINATTTMTVTNVPTAARSVDFYLRPTGTGIDTGNLIGTDNNLADGSSIQWKISSGLLGHINAEAKNSSGAIVASSDFVLVYVADAPVGIPSSPFDISPIVVSEGDQFQLQLGAVVSIGVFNPPSNADSVHFYFRPTGTGSTRTLIGSDQNMADGVSILWTVPFGSFSGHIEGEAVRGGVTSSIGIVTVFGSQ